MRFYRTAIMAAATAVAFSSPAGSHHPVAAVAAPITRALGIQVGGSAVGGSAVVLGIGVAAVAIVWCAHNQPKRNMRRDTWVDARHDVYPTSNPRKYGCVVKGKELKPLAVRG